MNPSNTILIDFDALVDYKVGLIQMFKAYKNRINQKLINQNYLNLTTEQLCMEHMYSVEDIAKKVFQPNIQNIYKDLLEEFLNGEYESDIYKCSALTNQVKVVKAFATSNIVDFTILCKNKVQEKFINEFPFMRNHTKVENRNSINITPYGRITIGYIQDAIEFDKPIMKNFLVSNFRENFEPDNQNLLLKNYIVKLMDVNKFQIFESYLFDKPKG